MELCSITGLKGSISVPGDKSISHRCVMFGSIASGTTVIRNFLKGADCMATINCFRRLGIEIEEENVLWITTGDVEQMKDERNRYLRRMREVTACLCYNDTVAGELMSICLESGIRVPEELSIMGIDDADMSKDLPVPLTTVHNPLQRLGKLSAEVVMKMIAQGDVEEAYELKASVVERSSVRAYME